MTIDALRQLSVALENQPGRLAQVSRMLADRGIRIEALCVIDNVEQGMVRMVTSDPDAARAVIAGEGLPVVEAEVLSVVTTDRLGRLADVAQALGGAGINIEYAYASVDHAGAQTRLILKTSRARQAQELLRGMQEH